MSITKKVISPFSDHGIVAFLCMLLPVVKEVGGGSASDLVVFSMCRILFPGGVINPVERELLEELLVKIIRKYPHKFDVFFGIVH